MLETPADDDRLKAYQPYRAARAGQHGAAIHAHERAIGLEADPAVRRFLRKRRDSA